MINSLDVKSVEVNNAATICDGTHILEEAGIAELAAIKDLVDICVTQNDPPPDLFRNELLPLVINIDSGVYLLSLVARYDGVKTFRMIRK